MSRLWITLSVLLAAVLAAAVLLLVPRGIEAGWLLANQDDPTHLADRALDKVFDGKIAVHEVETALAAGDADLAQSFVDLAKARGIGLPPALLERVAAANAAAARVTRAAGSFVRGLVTGEPDDVVGLA